MEYRSPLGSSFKLQKSLAALDDSANETPRKPPTDFIPIQPTHSAKKNYNGNQHWQKGNVRMSPYDGNPGFSNRNSSFDGNTGYNIRQSNNRNSGNQGHNQRRNSIPISEYYHPSMVEDPWKDLIEKT